MDLVKLQQLIHKSPDSYQEDFLQQVSLDDSLISAFFIRISISLITQTQLRHFEAQVDLFNLKPDSGIDKAFVNLINFLTSVIQHYRSSCESFSGKLMALLNDHATVITADLRMILVKSLIRIRTRQLLSPSTLLPLFFKLFRVHDKQLRTLLSSHIVGDIRRCNRKRNVQLNKQLQNFMYTMLKDESEIAQKKSLEICCALYRKGVWRDAKTVNVIASACLSTGKVLVPALRFFIDPNALDQEDEEDQRQKKAPKKSLHQKFSKHSKMTRGKKRRMLIAHKEEIKEQKQKMNKDDLDQDEPSFPALELLYDPQGFAEKVFTKLRKSTEKFEIRVMMMRVISKVIKCHKLQVLPFYGFLQKYLQPHQQMVTVMLICLIESCHELVPPETLQPLVRHIQVNFCSEYRGGPIIQLGINSLREIAVRAPLALDQETVRDIAQFKGYQKDKGVVMAARALINLYRLINPGVLHAKDRGRDGQMNVEFRQPLAFGEVDLVEQDEDDRLYESNSEASDEYSSFSEETNPLNQPDLDEEDIVGFRSKMTKEEKLLVLMSNKEGATQHWKDRWEEKTSTTNKRKRKNKPFMLTKYSAALRKKRGLSLHQKQKLDHVRRQKASGRRFFKGNNLK